MFRRDSDYDSEYGDGQRYCCNFFTFMVTFALSIYVFAAFGYSEHYYIDHEDLKKWITSFAIVFFVAYGILFICWLLLLFKSTYLKGYQQKKYIKSIAICTVYIILPIYIFVSKMYFIISGFLINNEIKDKCDGCILNCGNLCSFHDNYLMPIVGFTLASVIVDFLWVIFVLLFVCNNDD